MKRTSFLAALLCAAVLPSALLAQGTVFTYQGFLNDSGAPANRTNYGMVFYLYAAPTNGSALANFGVVSVTVSNGLFTTPVGFGSVFDGTPRWLEITVQKNGGAFTTLQPRQQILPTPYAIMAGNASNALTATTAGSVSAANITGSLSLAQLPPSLLTNNQSGVTLGGTFSGNGGDLTNLNAANLSSGTLADARLSSNVALLNGTNVFTGTNRFGSVMLATNGNNLINGAFAGNGGGLTNLNAANLTGTLADARLSTNVALLNANQIFSGSNTFRGVALLTNANNTLSGNGAALTALNAANVASGTLADARLSTNVAFLNATQAFSGTVQFNGTVSSGSFTGNGAGLTNLDLGQNSGGAIKPVSFTLSSQPSFIGDNPSVVIAADINRDSKPDLIVGGSGAARIYILTNNGSGAFVLSSSNTLTLGSAQFVVAADVNGDTNLDLICALGSGNAITILTNNGSGGFALSANITASAPSSVAVADFNGDGKPDLAYDFASSGVQILTNNGSGGFVFFENISAPGISSVTAADVNNDGKMDLINVDTGTGSIVVLTNNGSGGFTQSGTISPVTAKVAIAADVNGDNKLDIIAPNYAANTIAVFTNNGSGGFALASSPLVGNFPQSVAAADLDGDGRLDLVSANSGPNTVSVLINVGGGNFALRATLAVGMNPLSVAVADLNGDGRPDVVTANGNSSNLSVLLNKGFEVDGTFVGNGASLSNLNASQLISGTIADARLSANVALLNANQTFSASNTFAGVATLTNANNRLAGTYSGNGAALTNISAANINGALPINTTLIFTGNRTNGIANPIVYVENTNTSANASPALRVQNDGGNTPSGALSVSANVTATSPNSAIATFGNASAFVVTITNDGTIYSKGVALTSDRNAKEKFTAVDGKLILEKVAAMPISEWDYKDTPGPRHLGPVAQDFHTAFGLNGADDTHISVVDEGGVALAAIQGLNRKLEEQRAELERSQAECADLRNQLRELRELLTTKSQQPTRTAK